VLLELKWYRLSEQTKTDYAATEPEKKRLSSSFGPKGTIKSILAEIRRR
jgi:hypothetical protein